MQKLCNYIFKINRNIYNHQNFSLPCFEKQICVHQENNVYKCLLYSKDINLRFTCSKFTYLFHFSWSLHFNSRNLTDYYLIVGSVVEWLKRPECDRHGLASKPTCAILLCPWE